VSDDFTVFDLQLYCELDTIFSLLQTKPDEELCPNLTKWYEGLVSIPEVNEIQLIYSRRLNEVMNP